MAAIGWSEAPDNELRLASRAVEGNQRQVDLSVPDIHCGGCVQKIEQKLGELLNVKYVRVNLSTKRVCVRWEADAQQPDLIKTLNDIGFDAFLMDSDTGGKDPATTRLLRSLAVAGFAAGNIMLLSVSVWLGADPAMRDIFHWVSASIALPTLVYSGSVFYRSAWSSLRHWQTNMDVPISIGITVAFAMSLYDTIHHGEHAYFDASVTLLFFLLIGRTLDHLMREKARLAVKGLASYAARGATMRHENGEREYVPLSELEPGTVIILAAGERVPVDACVLEGSSDIDNSLVTGEGMPISVEAGADLRAGTLNLTGPLIVRATAAAKDSFLAEITRLVEAAESGRGAYRRLADQASRLYAPVVHLAALSSFVVWIIAGADFHMAATVAVAVLIITCPCALGLAVPMVQVVAARRLFEERIMMRDGSALERLNEVDCVVFDKTGTLTLGKLTLRAAPKSNGRNLSIAKAMAAYSKHPCSIALCRTVLDASFEEQVFDQVAEVPGFGMEARQGDIIYRLGRAEWALSDKRAPHAGTILSRNGELLETFLFDDVVRPDASGVIAELISQGISVSILSGDNASAVGAVADKIGVKNFHANMLPADKIAYVTELAAEGRKVMMVGDGLNDTPALVAAHVSMAPATAADVGRNAADFVFLRESLSAVTIALSLSHQATNLIKQNFGLALAYNVIALPAAALGYVTPLIAALTMSLSSIMVVGNALRLSIHRRRRA